METLGILTLGQTPRPDMEQLFTAFLPDTPVVTEGALDTLSQDKIQSMANEIGDYPLLVVLANQTTKEISMQRLIPYLEKSLVNLAAKGASQAVLMCAGNFPLLKSPIPVLYPGRLIPQVAKALCPQGRLGVVTPNPGQKESARENWTRQGFSVVTKVASPKNVKQFSDVCHELNEMVLDLVILDCMGFNPEQAKYARRKTGHKIICPQSLVARVCQEIMGQ